jgi:hypothetical protein
MPKSLRGGTPGGKKPAKISMEFHPLAGIYPTSLGMAREIPIPMLTIIGVD